MNVSNKYKKKKNIDACVEASEIVCLFAADRQNCREHSCSVERKILQKCIMNCYDASKPKRDDLTLTNDNKDTQMTYTLIGDGYCRTKANKKVNALRIDIVQTHTLCKQICNLSDACFGYSYVTDFDHKKSGRCYIHVTPQLMDQFQEVKKRGMRVRRFEQPGLSIEKASGHTSRKCYKKNLEASLGSGSQFISQYGTLTLMISMCTWRIFIWILS